MSQKSGPAKLSSERIVKDIRRATRKQYSAEEKIRIGLDGLGGEHSIAELCRREGIAESLYYTWSKEFLEAGKRRLANAGGAHSCSTDFITITCVSKTRFGRTRKRRRTADRRCPSKFGG